MGALLGKLTERADVEVLSVGQVLERSVQLCPAKIALVYEGQRITYRELNERVDALASALQSLGIRKGDRVCVALLNVPEIVYSFFAIARIGAAVAWANPGYRTDELTFIMRNSGSVAAIFHRDLKGFDYLKLFAEVRPELPSLKHVILLDAPDVENVHDVGDLMRRHAGRPYDQPPIDIHEDLVLFYNTGGTTGVPKAAAHAHYTAVMRATSAMDVLKVTSDDVTLALLPIYHAFGGSMCMILPLATQQTTVLMTEYHAEKALQLIETERVTLHHAAPTHIILETKLPNFRSYDVSSLRTGLGAGFAWPPEIFMRAKEEMGLDLVHLWGMAEMGGTGLACTPEDGIDRRNTCIGRPLEGEVKVVDPETGREMPPNEPGELLFRGPMMKFYWNNPEETAKAFDAEGWFRTGDLVVQDEEGYVRIVGRAKEQINRGGLKIVPNEVEALLIKHPKIKELCVISTPNPVLGESICACVVPLDDDKPTLQELRDFLKDKIAAYKLPEELCLFESFPRLAGGVKLRKFGPGSIQEMAINDERRERLRR
ncbi:MAG: acyl--CoA ligase [Chloroflexi bacterium]|nr:acyl--CoA ligase [Chloroflexota bacterium]